MHTHIIMALKHIKYLAFSVQTNSQLKHHVSFVHFRGPRGSQWNTKTFQYFIKSTNLDLSYFPYYFHPFLWKKPHDLKFLLVFIYS